MDKIKFRRHVARSGSVILAGKDAKSNEALISQVEPEEEVFHTALPGSPFVNIKGKAKKEDIKEAAIFCSRYSQDWRDHKKDVLVHRFKGKDIYKEKGMKLGTFGVKRFKIVKVKAQDIKNWEAAKNENITGTIGKKRGYRQFHKDLKREF